MNQHRCTLPGISVQFNEGGKRFAVGELVDFDAQARPGLPWRTALGALAETFEPVAIKAVKRQAEE
jgi:hypothetical protein